MDYTDKQDYSIEALPVGADREEIKAQWECLTAQCSHSYFLSWGWIESWLQSQQDTSQLYCVLGYQKGKPCFGFFIGSRNYRKFGLFPTRAAHLNATGLPALDLITIEYNDILAAADCARVIPDVFSSKPLSRFNEFVFPGTTSQFAHAIRQHSKPFYFTANEQLSYSTNLSKVREAGDYLTLLSSNKRQQIRRSIREFEKSGPIQHYPATDVQQAQAMFDQMGELHSKAWSDRGKPGSFANKSWVQFHRTLIENRFQHGEIYIGEFSTGSTALGFIYGFVYDNKFLFCQSGFNYQDSNILRPGLVSHVLLIQEFATKGLDVYDFLAGDSDYKQSLATDKTSVWWLALQRRSLQFRVAMTLKKAFLSTCKRYFNVNPVRLKRPERNVRRSSPPSAE